MYQPGIYYYFPSKQALYEEGRSQRDRATR